MKRGDKSDQKAILQYNPTGLKLHHKFWCLTDFLKLSVLILQKYCIS